MGSALLQPEPCAAWWVLLDVGWTDALRWQSPQKPISTCCSYLRNRRPRVVGMRIDYLLVSNEPVRQMKGAGVDRAGHGLKRQQSLLILRIENARAMRP